MLCISLSKLSLMWCKILANLQQYCRLTVCLALALTLFCDSDVTVQRIHVIFLENSRQVLIGLICPSPLLSLLLDPVPLLSRLLPSDICRVYKTGSCIRYVCAHLQSTLLVSLAAGPCLAWDIRWWGTEDPERKRI